MNQSRDRRRFLALAVAVCLVGQAARGQEEKTRDVKIEDIRKSVSVYLRTMPEALTEPSKVATVDPSRLELVDGKLVWSYQRNADTPLSAEGERTLGDQLRKVLEGALQENPIQGDTTLLVKGLMLKALPPPTPIPPSLSFIERIRESISKFMRETPKPELVAEASKVATVESSRLDMVDGKLVWSYQPKSGAALNKEDHDTLLKQLRLILQAALQKYPVEIPSGVSLTVLIEGLTITPPPAAELIPTSRTSPPVPGKSLPEAEPSKQDGASE
jgi:hypothetical protein